MNARQEYTEQEVANFFKNATYNQKCAMVGLLLFMYRLDETYAYSADDIELITFAAINFSRNIGVDSVKAVDYFNKCGLQGVLNELRALEATMKTCYMLIADGLYPGTQIKNGKTEATFCGYMFGLMSMSAEKYDQVTQSA